MKKSKKKVGTESTADHKDLSVKELPDYLQKGLDIVFIGLNPSVHAAWTGRYYDGPGNHFWQALHQSGFVPELMKAADDYKLVDIGIGFTNLVSRPTRTSTELSRTELEEGSRLLRAKLVKYKPKIAVFNGRIIYEVFSNSSKFKFGLQPESLCGTEILEWVMPSSSARCSLLPTPRDKVPIFSGLRRFRDFLLGRCPRPPESELVFSNLTSRSSPKKVLKEEFILKKEELPSTSKLSASQQNEKFQYNKSEDSSDSELEMPVLQAEVPFHAVRRQPPKQPQPRHQSKHQYNKESSPSPSSSKPENTSPETEPTSNNPSAKRKSKIKDRYEEGSSSSSTSSSSPWLLVQEKPKTSDKCYKKRKISLSSDSDNTESRPNSPSEDTESVFEKLIQSKPVSSIKNKPRQESPLKMQPLSPLKLQSPTESSSLKLQSPTEPSMKYPLSSPTFRRQSPRIAHTPTESPRRSPTKTSSSPVKCEGMTSIWGKNVSSFDLSDDYVNDYIKEQKAKKIEESPSLLMIAPKSSKVKSRSGSLDVIPACLPESVGTEIEDILQSGFDEEERYLLSPLSSGSNAAKANKPKGVKPKKTRNKSQDNLHPNLLPEDYLDEVIGQYFNAEEEESTGVEDGEEENKQQQTQTDVKPKQESEESTDDDVQEETKARIRPPASFYSMDFLDEMELDPENEEEEEHQLKQEPKKGKVKTEFELEAEYRHILYGGKKKKSSKLGYSKKKRRRKAAAAADSPPAAAGSNNNDQKKGGVQKNKKKVLRRGRRKKRGAAAAKKTTAVVSPEPAAVQLLPRTRSSAGGGATNSKVAELTPPSSAAGATTSSSLAWKGKKASRKAYDRANMRAMTKRVFTSSKIEDVTGKYGKEEELVSCGICDMLDPPAEDLPLEDNEVEWVGCDCYRWFHKPCTKLMKITEKFSCRSVKMKCLDEPPKPVKLVTAEPVIKSARVKFIPDTPRLLIKNL